MPRFRAIVFASLLLLSPYFLLPPLTSAYTNPGKPTGFVNDFAGVLSVEDKSFLENKLSALEKSTSDEISIVIIKSLGGDTIENFAVKLYADWGIGKEAEDNGALILVALEDREIRIEVGYGLEPVLTDLTSSRIINETITPKFKTGDYAGGLSDGVDQITSLLIGGTMSPEIQTEQPSNFNWFYYIPLIFLYFAAVLGRSKSWWLGGVFGGFIGVVLGFVYTLFVGLVAGGVLILLGLLIDFFVSGQYAKHKSAGTAIPWWIGGGGGSGGFGGGGFGGFGGGMSGGGGSSGRW